MQVVHDTTLQGVRPFFGCNSEIRGEYFTHLNYNGSEFGVAINQGNVPLIESQPVFQLLLSKNYTNNAQGEDFHLHQDMVDLITNAAAFHRLVDAEAKGGNANAAPFVNYLYNSVYKGWGNLSSDVRKFYQTFLHVLVKLPENAGWGQPADVAIAAQLPATDVRLNLTKVNKDRPDSGILFAETLPKLTPAVKGFKFTSGGDVQKVDLPGGAPEDLLKQIYNSVYANSAVIVNGTNHGNVAYINCDITKPAFHLDSVKFSKSVLQAHATGVSAKQANAAKAAALNKDNFDDIFTSLTTGVTFVKDGNDLFRVDGDAKTRVKLDEAQLEVDVNESCHGTKITGDCDVVFKCLLSGSPKNLSRCLGKLQDQNMFKVAEREVEKMNPAVAKQLLQTFGFNLRKEMPTGLTLPPSFDEWVQNILPKSVDENTRTTILGNQQLMNYLKGVVSLIRNNPVLIDSNAAGSAGVSPYATKAGLQTFIQPKTLGDKAALTASILEQGVLLSRPAINTLPFTAGLGNIGMNMGMIGMLGMTGGGSKPECVNANMLKNMFDVTYSEMERNGKVLVDADKKRIEDSIKRVGHLEEQLIKILEDLKLFSKLNTTFNIGRNPIGVEEVALTEVVGASNAATITGEAVNNLKNCASQNITEQSRLMSDLILQIQRSLVGTLMGNERNPLLERVYSGRM